MNRPPPKLRLVTAPAPAPTSVRRLDLNTMVVCCATSSTLTFGLERRHKALLVVHDVAACGVTPELDPRQVLGDLFVYSCAAGAPERAATRYCLDNGTLIRSIAVLSALISVRHLTMKDRCAILLTTNEGARAWWRAGISLMAGWGPHGVAVEATVEGAAHRLAYHQSRGERALAIVDGIGRAPPPWSAIVAQLKDNCPEVALLGLTTISHVDTFGVRALLRGIDVVVGLGPENETVWAALAGDALYAIREATGDPDRRSAS